MSINNNLRKYRLKKKLTQQAVSNLANISLTTYQQIETGKRNPYIITAVKICRALGITLENYIIDIPSNIDQVIEEYNFQRLNSTYKKVNCKTRIAILRKNLRKSQSTIARLAEISIETYRRIEKGECIPNIITALKLARAFNTDVGRLFVIDRTQEIYEKRRFFIRTMAY